MTTSFSITTVSPGTCTSFHDFPLDHHFHGDFDRLDDLFLDDDGFPWNLYLPYHLFHHFLNDHFHGHFDGLDDLFFSTGTSRTTIFSTGTSTVLTTSFSTTIVSPGYRGGRWGRGFRVLRRGCLSDPLLRGGRRSSGLGGLWGAGFHLRAGERQHQDYQHTGDYQL